MYKKLLMSLTVLIMLLVTFGTANAYLDSKTGRFITQDPYLGEITRPPSIHRYNYVKSNPASFVDRNGYDYVEVRDNKAYWVIEKDIPGPFNPDTRRVYIGYSKENDPKNVYLTTEFGDGRVALKKLKLGASSYWGRYDIEEEKSVFNPADISSLDPSLQDQLIHGYIHDLMDPHMQGGIYADRPRFRYKTTRNLDRVQTAGDYVGMVPGVGNVVDVSNTVLYGLRGKWEDFGFGVVAWIPIVGQGSTATKYARRGEGLIDDLSKKIFADNSVLVEALEQGNEDAINILKSNTVLITPNQYNEFIKSGVNNVGERLKFLEEYNISVLNGQQARVVASQQIFKDVFNRVVKEHGRNDAALLSFSKTTGIEVVTIEKGIYNLGTKSLPNKLKINMIKIPSVRR